MIFGGACGVGNCGELEKTLQTVMLISLLMFTMCNRDALLDVVSSGR